MRLGPKKSRYCGRKSEVTSPPTFAVKVRSGASGVPPARVATRPARRSTPSVASTISAEKSESGARPSTTSRSDGVSGTPRRFTTIPSGASSTTSDRSRKSVSLA